MWYVNSNVVMSPINNVINCTKSSALFVFLIHFIFSPFFEKKSRGTTFFCSRVCVCVCVCVCEREREREREQRIIGWKMDRKIKIRASAANHAIP